MDRFIDEYFIRYCSEKVNLIIDYRLAYYFLKDCFHVYLQVSDEVAAERIHIAQDRELEFNEHSQNKSLIIKERNQKMKERFLKLYNTDFTDKTNYDLIIDTDNLTVSEILDIILSKR